MIYRVTDCGVKPHSAEQQTEALQQIFDRCKQGGGTVVFPRGAYHFSGVLIPSDTTVLLESGALLLGSKECGDYPVFPVPEGVELRTDVEMIPWYFSIHGNTPRSEYRRAMFSAYGEENIAIIGEPGSVIDGQNCYDPDGEEGYRGPHGIWLSSCKNVTLKGYTIQHNGNFMHQLDCCEHVTMTDVTCLGGSDGIHLHCCSDMEINRCVFRTGDDCIAGINIRGLHVNNCVLNTSCQVFRMGGTDILVENCHAYGPGYYPHRMTVVRSRTEELPREEGRHNLLAFMIFFASDAHPAAEHSRNIVFRNMIIENAQNALDYRADSVEMLQSGDRLTELTFDNVRFTGLGKSSLVEGAADEPLTVRLRGVTWEFAEGEGSLFHPDSANVNVIEE